MLLILGLPKIPLADRAPIAAFSLARPNDAELERTLTWVLWLDPRAGRINVVYTDVEDGSTSWKTDQPEVLGKVDRDSKIACTTMAMSWMEKVCQSPPVTALEKAR